MTTTQLAIPTIHDNGTSANSLTDAIEDAYAALSEAYDKLRETAPNGRDYYTQSPAALPQAWDEHRSRLQRIQDVQKELALMCEGINEQRN